MIYLQIALDLPLDILFDYSAQQASPADIGRRVVVSFGPRRVIGVIMGLSTEPQKEGLKIKPVEAILCDMPALAAPILALLRFASSYYQHPIGQVVHCALPSRFRDPKPFSVVTALLYQATDPAELLAKLPARAVAQQRLAHLLQNPVTQAQIRQLSPQASKLLQNWLEQGWVSAKAPRRGPIQCAVSPVLNSDQAHAVAALRAAKGFAVHLLHGITGSGKTEVYLQIIASVLEGGQQALLLVPEINLTPQLEARFRQRFPGASIVSLNSGVADGERAQAWVQAAKGDADLVLGTRLAVFTPMPRLALIVVDEEHDASFKQQEGLRYSARDLAVLRASAANISCVLGSATPSLESWHNAQSGRYRLLSLHERAVAGAKPPSWQLLATKRQSLQDGLHPAALDAIAQRLARNEQSLVFINRRGYAPVMHCGECGWMAACTRCAARLTVHLSQRHLRCHHCGWQEAISASCPGCGNRDLNPVGHGTQRLEAMLQSRFPHARVLRIDRDSMLLKGSFERALKLVHEGRVDILIGTQMLAKGHDFPKLTLVVVVGADNGLYSADYRASERLYAQLAQVAGRAGRAEHAGSVCLQTEITDHPLYAALLADDFAAFAERELGERQTAGFPPYLHQALLRADAEKMEDAMAFLHAARLVAPQDPRVTLWDPVAASMAKVNGRERVQLLVQSGSRSALQAWLTQWMQVLRAQKVGKVRWSLDVDPLEV